MKKVVIGDCELHHGDSRDIVSWGDIAFDSVVTDPPYGMAYQSNHRDIRHEKIANDESEEL